MASSNIARLGVILGLDTAEFTSSIDKAVSENRKLGREMERSTKKALEDAQNLKYATEDYGKTLTKVQELERNLAAGRYQGAQQSALDELRKRAVAYDAIAVSATKVAKVTDGTVMNQQQKLQLMYQSTDLFTQLISGQNMMVALIQQGGQLKDSMGGVGNMFRMLWTLITPVRVAIGGVTAALGFLSYAAYSGRKEFDAINNSIILTGNYSKVTADDVNRMATSLSNTSRATVGGAKDIISAMISSGQFTKDTFGSVYTVIQRFAELSGKSGKDAAAALIPMLDGTASSAKRLNEQYNFLTISQYRHIEALANQGKYQESTKLTSDLLNASLSKQKNELGYIDLALDAVAKKWSEMWNAAKGWGAPDSTQKELDKVAARIDILTNPEFKAKETGDDTGKVKRANEAELATLRSKQAYLQEILRLEKKEVAPKEEDKDKIKEAVSIDQIRKDAVEWAKVRSDAYMERVLIDASEREKIDLEYAKKTADLAAEYAGRTELEKRTRGAVLFQIMSEKQEQLKASREHQQAELTRKYRKENQDSVDRAMEQIKEIVSNGEKEYENAKKVADARTDLLQLTNDELMAKMGMIGMSEQEIALEKIRLEYVKKRKDINDKPMTDDRRKMELAALYEQEALEKTNVVIKEKMKLMEDMSTSIFTNMGSAIDNFVKTGKLSFKDFARSVIQDLIAIQMKASATTILGSLFKMFTGSNTGNTSGPVDGFGGAYADGGSPPVNVPSLIGERGPELFVPRTAGTIIPNNAIAKIGSTTNVTNYNIQAIDTKSFEDRILGSSKAVWAANAYGAKNLALGRGRT